MAVQAQEQSRASLDGAYDSVRGIQEMLEAEYALMDENVAGAWE